MLWATQTPQKHFTTRENQLILMSVSANALETAQAFELRRNCFIKQEDKQQPDSLWATQHWKWEQ